MRAELREIVTELAAIDRPSASAGERAAALRIQARFEALGVSARIEEERAHGTYWWPLGLCSAAGALAGRRGSRAAAVAVGAAAAAGIVDDVSAGPHVVRRALRSRTTYNVVAEAGPADAERTLVFLAHHDAAHGGFIFWDKLATAPMDAFPGVLGKAETSPPVMQLVAAGPGLVALGALLGSRRLRALGTLIAAGATAAFADIGARRVVPGANDNLTAVATELVLARTIADDLPRGLRVMFVSTGSEESFMEGMRGFARRHFGSLDPARTRFVCLESLGSPELLVIEGEGMIRMADYAPDDREFLAACGERAGHPLRRGLRLGLATDGLIALRGGYPTSVLASCTKYKFPANYHSMKDTAENVDYGTVAAAVEVCREVIRSS
jgi:hypothetical protein